MSVVNQIHQHRSIREYLPDAVPVVGFSLGYPAEDPAPRDRLPLDGLVHHETYQDYSDARVQEVYRERDVKGWERYMSIPRLRQMVEASDVENLAQIYTKLKYTRESHQYFSNTVLDYLAEQGFMEQLFPRLFVVRCALIVDC